MEGVSEGVSYPVCLSQSMNVQTLLIPALRLSRGRFCSWMLLTLPSEYPSSEPTRLPLPLGVGF